MKKLAAFTIIELMITLLISSIVISMGYFAYFLLTGQFSRYRVRAEKIREYSALATVWRIDFDRSVRIVDTLDNNHILFERGDTLVRYSVDSNSIIRESTIRRAGDISDIGMASGSGDAPGIQAGTAFSRDSFGLKASVLDTWYVDDSLRLVKGIKLRLELNNRLVLLTGTKTWSAQEIMLAETKQHE